MLPRVGRGRPLVLQAHGAVSARPTALSAAAKHVALQPTAERTVACGIHRGQCCSAGDCSLRLHPVQQWQRPSGNVDNDGIGVNMHQPVAAITAQQPTRGRHPLPAVVQACADHVSTEEGKAAAVCDCPVGVVLDAREQLQGPRYRYREDADRI